MVHPGLLWSDRSPTVAAGCLTGAAAVPTLNRTYRLKQKFPDSNEAPAMPTVLDHSQQSSLAATPWLFA